MKADTGSFEEGEGVLLMETVDMAAVGGSSGWELWMLKPWKWKLL